MVEFEGSLNQEELDDRERSDKILYRGEFGSLQKEGRYYISIGGVNSSPFRISEDLYMGLAEDCLHSISLVKANVDIQDETTGFEVKAGHLGDFNINGKDYSGGWYNAGDFGKWTHCTAINIANILWLRELHSDLPPDMNDKLLREARWGMDWLLKMQESNGAVYHKVDSEPHFAWGKKPSDDPHQRSVKWTRLGGEIPSSVDAGDFIGAASLCSRIFSERDPDFSRLCRLAAERSWEWILDNPDNGQDDPYYTDTCSSEEFFWAAAEIYLLNGDSRAQEYLENQNRWSINTPGWRTPDFFGSLALLSNDRTNTTIRQREYDLLKRTADYLLQETLSHPFGHSMDTFWWGSNFYISGSGQLLAAAYLFTEKEKYREAALSQIHYLLGLNGLNRSFVAGYGSRSMEHPYHWSYYVYNIVLPGWIAGGVNPIPQGADPLLDALQNKPTPPALCYVDECAYNGSWASNEGTLAMVSSLMFLAGIF